MEIKKTQLEVLGDYVEIFIRRKWFFILAIIPIAGIALLISFDMPPLYKSTTTILVERQKLPETYVKPTIEYDMKGRLHTLETQIMSRTRLLRIIDEYGLYQYTPQKPGFINTFLKKFGFEKQKKPILREEALNKMRGNIEIIINRGEDAFTLSYTASDPEVAMRVANALASMFIEENFKIREQRAEGTTEFLSNELEMARKELEKQETALSAFKEKNMGSLPEQINANLRTLDRLQLELQSLSNSANIANDRKVIMEEQLSDLRNVSNENGLVSLEKDLAGLKNEYSSLRAIYKDNYPDIIIIKNRIKEIEGLLASGYKPEGKKENNGPKISIKSLEEQRLLSQLQTINSEIKSMKDREALVKKRIKNFEKRVEESSKNEQKMTALERDYETMKNNYQSLLDKRLNAKLSENMEKRQKGEQFRILDPANLPEKPTGAVANKVRLIGLIAGAGLGVGLIALVEFLNPAFRKPEDFMGLTEIPVLATIPNFAEKIIKK